MVSLTKGAFSPCKVPSAGSEGNQHQALSSLQQGPLEVCLCPLEAALALSTLLLSEAGCFLLPLTEERGGEGGGFC